MKNVFLTSRETHFPAGGCQPQRVKKMDIGRGAHPKLYYVEPPLTGMTSPIKHICTNGKYFVLQISTAYPTDS